jgi:hypothetical protein
MRSVWRFLASPEIAPHSILHISSLDLTGLIKTITLIKIFHLQLVLPPAHSRPASTFILLISSLWFATTCMVWSIVLVHVWTNSVQTLDCSTSGTPPPSTRLLPHVPHPPPAIFPLLRLSHSAFSLLLHFVSQLLSSSSPFFILPHSLSFFVSPVSLSTHHPLGEWAELMTGIN